MKKGQVFFDEEYKGYFVMAARSEYHLLLEAVPATKEQILKYQKAQGFEPSDDEKCVDCGRKIVQNKTKIPVCMDCNEYGDMK